MTPKHCPKCGCLMTVDDEGAPYHHGKHWAETDLTFCLKRQLDAAKERVKRLEEAADKLLELSYECDCRGTGIAEARLAYRKAKEAKP